MLYAKDTMTGRGASKNMKTRGFTIVELLIVIVVIAILAVITIVAFNGVQQRARDSRRSSDMANIKRALLIYQANNGGVPKTSTYGSSSGPGGWDSSIQPNWISFLQPQLPQLPKDPVNTGTTDPTFAGNLLYYYYCYNAGAGPQPATANVRIGYHSEQSGANVNTDFPVDKCL